ncbi:MAG: UMP kinase [Methanomassiliicoccaceae archaeon]|jgi:uridylate kinase|nr:UMP kinase [Methanomassiliicoccaceae archaeon]
MEKVVVSIGGSILIPDDKDAIFIRKLADLLADVSEKVHMVIVCGGGKIARYYTGTGRELGGSVYDLDMMGIGATRLNAELLRIALGGSAYGAVPLTVDEAAEAFLENRIVVMGGTEPGHTTDAVAAMVAGKTGCERIINATSVDAVYSDDPKKDPNAKRFTKLTIGELDDIVYDEHDAGRSSVFDPLGVKLAMRDRIDILIVSGRDLDEMRNALLGKKIKGTTVISR